MIADRNRIYFTFPARYLFKCPNCGNVEYGLCSDDDGEENEDNGTIDENCTKRKM